MCLGDVFKEFIEDKKIDVTDSTIECIKNRYMVIDKYYKNIDIKKIDKQSVREFQRYMLNECKYSVNHTNNIVGLLKQLFQFAMERGMIEINMIGSVRMINKQVKIEDEKVIWSVQQFNEFEKAIESLRDKVIFNILFYLGVRKGELLSLKWNEVDFNNKTVSIISSAGRKKGVGQIITPPKTAKANRKIVMNEKLNELLKIYYLEIQKEHSNINECFVAGNENMLSVTSLSRLLQKYQEKTELPKITLHGFRHSHATMLVDISTNIKTISDRLGHSSVEVTLDTYVHSSIKSQQELVNQMESAIELETNASLMMFKKHLENILLNEMKKSAYSLDETKQIMNLYDYVDKKMVV